MIKSNIVGGFLWMILGAVIIQQSLSLEYWLSMGPGPGFMPLWSGILVAIGGLMLLGSACLKSNTSKEKTQTAPEKDGNLLLLIVILILTVISVHLMSFLGFGISMFVLLFTLIMLTRRHSKKAAFTISFIVVSGFYFLFSSCLRIPLPRFFIEF